MFEKGESVRELIQKCKDQGWEIYPAFPYILRMQAVPGLAELICEFEEEIDGVLVRNLESIRLLLQTGFDKTIITDHNLYVFNQDAKQFLMEYGVRKFTAPLELNYRELQKLCAEDCELMVYGYEPVMISAQCLEKNCSGCTKRPGYHFLTDRYNKCFSVKNVCDFCYNIIYNSEPLMLFSEAEDIQKLSPESLRLTFTKENRKEMDQIFSWYRNSFLENRPWSPNGQAYTKGHFRRGIK